MRMSEKSKFIDLYIGTALVSLKPGLDPSYEGFACQAIAACRSVAPPARQYGRAGLRRRYSARAGDTSDLGDARETAADLLEPVLAQPHHALVDRRVGDRLGGLARHG